MECDHTTPTPTITTDGSPGASVEGRKRKAGNKKATLKKRKLLAGVTSHNEVSHYLGKPCHELFTGYMYVRE